jgi:hypothetical protein
MPGPTIPFHSAGSKISNSKPEHEGQSITTLAGPSHQDWERHRALITRLYINERRKLKDVRAIMEQKYGHKARQVNRINPGAALV